MKHSEGVCPCPLCVEFSEKQRLTHSWECMGSLVSNSMKERGGKWNEDGQLSWCRHNSFCSTHKSSGTKMPKISFPLKGVPHWAETDRPSIYTITELSHCLGPLQEDHDCSSKVETDFEWGRGRSWAWSRWIAKFFQLCYTLIHGKKSLHFSLFLKSRLSVLNLSQNWG